MQNFEIDNQTKLLFRNDPVDDIANITKGKKVLFIYGGQSVRTNGCFGDVQKAVQKGNGQLLDIGNISRDLHDIERAIQFARENQVDFLIGAGGANIMDSAKVIAYGYYHDKLLDVTTPDGKHLPVILIPTYPSSGSEYNTYSMIKVNDEFSFCALTVPDYALLVPKYSLSLGPEMTAYASLVTFIQLATFVITDTNPVSYDQGIAVMKNVLKASYDLKNNPGDLTARGIILYSSSVAASGTIGISRNYEFFFNFYHVDTMVELALGSTYRKTITILFPRILKAMSQQFEKEITSFFKLIFDLMAQLMNQLTN